MLMGELPEKENNKKKYLEKQAELNSEIQALEYEIQQVKAEKNESPAKYSTRTYLKMKSSAMR